MLNVALTAVVAADSSHVGTVGPALAISSECALARSSFNLTNHSLLHSLVPCIHNILKVLGVRCWKVLVLLIGD